MGGPDEWPIKGKPVTNLIIQWMLAILFMVALMVLPLATFAACVVILVLVGGRRIMRDIVKEWWP